MSTRAGRGTPGTSSTRGGAHRVVVVGAGLTGLACAWRVRDDVEVVVLEASPRPGGEIRTVPFADTRVDVGADAFLARQPEAERLARSLGFGDDDLVAPTTGRVHLWVRGGLRPLPAGTVLGAPTDIPALARSGVLGAVGLLRAALEPVLPRREVIGDRSVADLVGERFGADVVDHLVEPLLGGVYAGSASRLSAQAASAPIWQAAQEHRSLLYGLRRRRAVVVDDRRPVFRTLRGGLGRLIDRLVDELGDRLRLSTPATSLHRDTDGGQWRVGLGDGTTLETDVVILAVPARVAATLLATTCPEAVRELGGIATSSVGTVALAYDRSSVAAVPDASGLLVPRIEGRLVKAVTLTSRKWPHHAEHDRFLLRASVGHVDDDRALAWDDDQLVARVEAELREAIAITGRAVASFVQRWPDGLPQYEVGHLARVDRLRAALRADAPGLHLGGASFDGLGLAARARDAERLAHEIRWEAGLVPRT